MEEKEVVSFVVGSKVKECWSGQGLRCAGETLDAVNEKVKQMLDEAARRCKGNGRSTVRPDDL